MAALKEALKTLGKQLHQPLNNARGIAILIAVACLLLITYIAIEVTYDTNIEYIVNSNGLNRIKSYYAAKAGVDIALLRIKIYQKVQSQFGKQMGSNASMLDEIWKFPFTWPLPVPADLNAVDKDSIQKMLSESTMDASYMVTIEDEGSKLDLNDLVSPSKVLRDNAKKQLLAIFSQKLKNDEEFGRKYSGYRFEDLIANIQGWMSGTSRLENNQDKRPAYQELNNQAGTTDYYPPNRIFRSLSELHFVPGMADEFYKILEPVVTLYGMKGINPNLAPKEVLLSLDPGMTEEAVKEIMKRRSDSNLGGPFKDANDFWTYANRMGARITNDTSSIPLIFENIMNFRIKSTGEYARVTSEIEAVVMDFSQTASKIKNYVDKEKQASNPQGQAAKNPATGQTQTTGSANNQTKSDSTNKGPPRIVLWSEK